MGEESAFNVPPDFGAAGTPRSAECILRLTWLGSCARGEVAWRSIPLLGLLVLPVLGFVVLDDFCVRGGCLQKERSGLCGLLLNQEHVRNTKRGSEFRSDCDGHIDQHETRGCKCQSVLVHTRQQGQQTGLKRRRHRDCGG